MNNHGKAAEENVKLVKLKQLKQPLKPSKIMDKSFKLLLMVKNLDLKMLNLTFSWNSQVVDHTSHNFKKEDGVRFVIDE
ncbi:Lovastatin diketide synthase LovF [Bienertia sinuspersici]